MIPRLGVDILVNLADKLTNPLGDVEDTVGAASERMKERLSLSLKFAGGGAAATGIAYGAQRLVSGFTDSIRDVERAKGELATLGVQDLDAVVKRGREMQMELAGVTADAFVRASYDIKSGISSLTDQGVADMTASAMIVAKATKGQAEQMTSLFATSYGIFKNQMADLTDAEFGEQFGASLAAAVQQFKTDGGQMQQAIESAGASAVSLGMSMSEELTLLGMMQQQMAAGEAGTALKSFASNAAKAHEAFGKMKRTAKNPVRVAILDENGAMRAMPDILADMKARYGETLDAFESAEIAKAFGTEEAMKLIGALYGQGDAVRNNAAALEAAAAQGEDYTRTMAAAADSNWDSTLVKISQQADVLRQMIGDRLLPVVTKLTPVIEEFMFKAFEWIDANPMLITGIGAVVVGLGAVAAVLGPVLLGVSSLISAWAALSFVSTRMLVGLSRMPLALLSLLNPIKIVRIAFAALRLAMISTGIGAIVVGIAMAGVWIAKNWGGLSRMFKGFGTAFMKALGPAQPIIAGIGAAIGDLMSWLGNLLGPINATGAEWEAWGERIGGSVGSAVSGLASFTTDLWQRTSARVMDGVELVKGAFSGIVGFDWASLLTLEGLQAAWTGVSSFVTSSAAVLFDVLSPLSWFGILNSEDLAAAWQSTKQYIATSAATLWAGIVAINWRDYVPTITWDQFMTALNWATMLHPLRWLEFIPGFEWSSVIAPLDMSQWFDFAWSDVLPSWDWSAIIPDFSGFNWGFGGEAPVVPPAPIGNRTSYAMTPPLAAAATAARQQARSDISFAPQYNVDVSIAGSADAEDVRAVVRQELDAANDAAQADARRLMHD